MLRIEPKTDVIALAAFVLAFGATAAQFIAWSRGPNVFLLGPERVALYYQQTDDGRIVRIAAPLAYANTAAQSYAAVLSGERVTMTLGPLSSRQDWNAFGAIARPGNSLQVSQTSLVTPRPVSGQSAVSHITLFTPVPRPCDGEKGCKPRADFLTVESVTPHLVEGSRIGFEFESSFFRDEPERYSCEVSVTKAVVDRWRREQSLYATCRPPSAQRAAARPGWFARTIAWLRAWPWGSRS